MVHTSSNIIGDTLAILRDTFAGLTYAYPDSGTFEMPNWKFEDVISAEQLVAHVREWRIDGVSAIGGCCGLKPDHIRALEVLG